MIKIEVKRSIKKTAHKLLFQKYIKNSSMRNLNEYVILRNNTK